jgi:Flp pilus assembly protein TadD
MPCFPWTALRQIALSDVVRLGESRLFPPVAALLALSIVVGGCAGLAPAPGELAGEDGEAKIAQAMRMAESVRASGDMAAAVVFYRRAHALAPEKLEPLIGLAQSAAAAGANEQAAEFYRQAVALAPDNAHVRLGFGRVLLALDRPDLAAPELRAAIDADPSDHRAYVALGVALDLSCDQRQAQEVYRDGLRHHPGNLSLRNNLALSLAFSGENEQSIEMLSELSRELGAGARVRQNLALVYSLAGRPDDAATIAQRNLTGARLRHNLALYESLRGVSGPRLAADVVCGDGRSGLMYSSLGRDRSTPRGGQIAKAGRRMVAAAGRADSSSWMTAERGATQAIGTGHVRATKVESAAESMDVGALRKVEEKAGSPGETSVVSYTVRHGDTLSLIAKKYYGNGRKYVALLEANSSKLAHPDKIYPGMVVTIPTLG